MRCEVEYCIYNRDFKCLIKVIQINSLGMCEECILVSLGKDYIESEKERQLREIEEKWEKGNKK